MDFVHTFILSLFMFTVGYRVVPRINEEFVMSSKELRLIKECNENAALRPRFELKTSQ